MTTSAQTGVSGPTRDEVVAIIQAAVARVLELDPSAVRPDTLLAEELGADSLALVEVVELVEEQLSVYDSRVTIDDDDIEDLTTIGAAADYVMVRLEHRRQRLQA